MSHVADLGFKKETDALVTFRGPSYKSMWSFVGILHSIVELVPSLSQKTKR